jgi:transposase, IS5 family
VAESRSSSQRHVVHTDQRRTGSEGRISSLKRGYSWDRTRLDGTAGAQIWAGYGVLAHNLVKIGALAS